LLTAAVAHAEELEAELYEPPLGQPLSSLSLHAMNPNAQTPMTPIAKSAFFIKISLPL